MTDLKPSDFQITDNPICSQLVNTLGRAELEFAAALIILWHQVQKHESFTEFSRLDVVSLFGSKETAFTDAHEFVLVWGRNPFWRPDPMGLQTQGFVEGWTGGREDAGSKGRFTSKFFEVVETERQRRQEKGLVW